MDFHWEGWSADLATGLFSMGDIARRHYGFPGSACGFIDLLRTSDPQDQDHILGLFEEAAVTSSLFCYATMIRNAAGTQYPVFCIGESSVDSDAQAGTITGVFAFPRFSIRPAGKDHP